MKKVIGQKFWGIFLPPFLELKVDFPSDWRRIRKCLFIKHGTAQFQHTHELVHGFTIKNLLVTLLRVQIELTLHRVHDAACEVVVLHGGCFAYLRIIAHSGVSVNRCIVRLMRQDQSEHRCHLENQKCLLYGFLPHHTIQQVHLGV